MKLGASLLVFFASSVKSGVIASGVRSISDDGPGDDRNLQIQKACACDGGYDYGCDQRECGPDATCGAGHCIQDGLVNPSCDGGDCSQVNATNPSCERGDCCPPAENCNVVGSDSQDCIGAEMLVFSCTHDTFLPVREVRVGDSIRCISPQGPVCSDVYYVFKHEATDDASLNAYSIEVQTDNLGSEEIVLSPNHILYVGDSFSNRTAVLAKNLRVGDTVLSSNENSTGKVQKIQATHSNLVNILTFEPAIELESGVVISAHSFHDTAYPYIFSPLALAYRFFGARAVESTVPTLEKLNENGMLNHVTSELFSVHSSMF